MGFVRFLIAIALLGGASAAMPATAGADGGAMCAANARIPDPGDEDCDGVRTDGNGPMDNCPSNRNADQTNTDGGYTADDPAARDGYTGAMPSGDGAGDACDADDDADGIADFKDTDGDGRLESVDDNCRLVRNPNQYGPETQYGGQDASGNALCPPRDSDGDGVFDDVDNCTFQPNPGQEDFDADRRGDVCDGDDDGDGVVDSADNCPRASNPQQEDADGDGIGAACDPGEAASVPPQDTTSSSADDGAAPGLVLRIARRLRSWDLLGGMPTMVRCSEACGLTARLTLSSRDARRLRLPRRLGRGEALLGAVGRTWLFVRVGRTAARRIPAAGVRATLSVTAVDEAGNRRTARRRITLRR